MNTAAIALPEPAAPRWSTAQTVALAIALAGAVLMALIAANLLFPVPRDFIGAHLYDVYARNLLIEHRWDLPARDLKIEGHFTSEGTGYLYYGLAPLLTRLPFLPFVEMPTGWISEFSMWLWAVIGTAAYHRAFWLGLAQGAGGADRINGWASALLAAAVWFAGPGLVIVAAGSVFDEPIVVAYALGGLFVLVLGKAAFDQMNIERAVLWLALIAGLMVHARPHLAVGFYLTVCLIALGLVWRGTWARWKCALGAMVILGAFGLAIVGASAARFGDPTRFHGSFSDETVQYAPIFWGTESPDEPRGRAFTEHGQFNASRIAPNFIVYFFSPPSNAGFDGVIDRLETLRAGMVAKGDHVSNVEPRVGLLFLWPAWILLMIVGLAQASTWRMPVVAGLAGVTVSALFMLSYMTITLRYHIDMWPLVALPALFGLSAVAKSGVADQRNARSWRSLLMVLAVLGLFVTLQKTVHSRASFVDYEGAWPREFCIKLAKRKGFDSERQAEICDPVEFREERL